MTDRSGRVNALACAILDADGDKDRLAEQLRFLSDLTSDEIDRAYGLAHWVKTEGGPQFMRQVAKPFLVSA